MVSQGRGTSRISVGTCLVAATLAAGVAATLAHGQTIPERSGPRRALPSAVILNGGTNAEIMQRVRVTRQYSLANVRSNPRVMVGEGSMDFTPMLNNPHALVNVAQRLHAMPQQVQVQEDSADVNEIEQGVIIHEVLTYKVRPGACSNPGGQAQLARAGVNCFTRSTPAQREASFSTPRDAHFVADPARRRVAMIASQNQTAAVQADATKHIADLRRELADPSQRAAISARIGAAETARLSSLSDDELEGEIINSGTQRFEETAFVPRTQSAYYAHPATNLQAHVLSRRARHGPCTVERNADCGQPGGKALSQAAAARTAKQVQAYGRIGRAYGRPGHGPRSWRVHVSYRLHAGSRL